MITIACFVRNFLFPFVGAYLGCRFAVRTNKGQKLFRKYTREDISELRKSIYELQCKSQNINERIERHISWANENIKKIIRTINE